MSCLKQAVSSSFRQIYRECPIFLNFCILYLFLLNGPRSRYVIPVCLKCIASIDLSPAIKILFIISFILHS